MEPNLLAVLASLALGWLGVLLFFGGLVFVRVQATKAGLLCLALSGANYLLGRYVPMPEYLLAVAVLGVPLVGVLSRFDAFADLADRY